MTTTTNFTLIAFFFLVVVTTSSGQKSRHFTGENEGLVLHAAASSNSVLPYEPIGVLGIFENTTDKEKQIEGFNFPDRMGVWFKSPTGDSSELNPSVVPLIGLKNSKTLSPHSSISWTDIGALPQPGTHEIQTAWNQFSLTFTVVVRTPQGRDKEALEFLKTSHLTNSIYAAYGRQNGQYTVHMLVELEKFASDFPDSYYSHLAMLAVGVAWTKHVYTTKHNVSLPKSEVELRNLDSVLKGITPHKRVDYSLLETKTDLNMAESALNKVIDKAPPQLRIVACYYLASVKIERGQVREAQGILKKILELNPNLYFRHLTQQKIKITDALLERSN